VVAELLSRQEGASRICRRYHISWNLLYNWKKKIIDNEARENTRLLYEQVQALRIENAALVGAAANSLRPAYLALPDEYYRE
jgi:transposase-like protein